MSQSVTKQARANEHSISQKHVVMVLDHAIFVFEFIMNAEFDLYGEEFDHSSQQQLTSLNEFQHMHVYQIDRVDYNGSAVIQIISDNILLIFASKNVSTSNILPQLQYCNIDRLLFYSKTDRFFSKPPFNNKKERKKERNKERKKEKKSYVHY